jgi:pimeloyl-ACP methyl ester carboxylesterase
LLDFIFSFILVFASASPQHKQPNKTKVSKKGLHHTSTQNEKENRTYSSMPPSSSAPRSKAGAQHSPMRPRDQFADVGCCGSTGRRVRLCYNTFGSPRDPCVLLVMGLASPALFWDDRWCTTLTLAGPFFVVRFDNRDVGCSTHFDNDGDDKEHPSSGGKVAGQGSTSYTRFAYAVLRPGKRTIPEVYTLMDMAADAFGLLDALHICAAHLVGSSMGGTVVQCMAIRHPQRVLSLSLLSTHSSSPQTQWPSLRDMMGFISLMPKSTSAKYATRIANATNAEERQRLCAERDAEKVQVYAASFTKLLERLAGNTQRYPFDRAAAHQQMSRVFRRSLYVNGGPRQFLALLNAPSRDEDLTRCITSVPPASSSKSTSVDTGSGTLLYVPTIIIHGDHDPLVPVPNARHLAAVIPGSRLYVVEGMGHTLIPALRDTYVRLIRDNIRAGEAAARLPARKAAAAAAAATKAQTKGSLRQTLSSL